VDFSSRARMAGMQSVYFAGAQAFHRGGGSSEAVRSRRLFYNLRSRIQYAWKHFSWIAALAVEAGTLTVEPAIRLLVAIARLSVQDIMSTAGATVRLWWFALSSSFPSERVRS